MKPLFPLPTSLVSPASEAQKLFDAQKYHEAIACCNRELAALEKQIPARNTKPPPEAEAGSAVFQYYALTVILANALAALDEWKAAKEALGKYRVRFPKDPWGFEVGAEVTRRDTEVKDKAAVQRAIELLEGEAERLRGQTA
ncbi:MAG: hypothetical protein HY741_19740 [Chloroflexi bacterium]|nr:hypothetical protein [Chloroflexota bacterium]